MGVEVPFELVGVLNHQVSSCLIYINDFDWILKKADEKYKIFPK